MDKKEISTQHLALLQLCSDPQSFQTISGFLNLNEEQTQKEIKFLKQKNLIEEISGPTYTLLQLTRKGKELLQL